VPPKGTEPDPANTPGLLYRVFRDRRVFAGAAAAVLFVVLVPVAGP
jgi:hypothetical protein